MKAIFHSEEMIRKAARKGEFFSSANSINWGRLVPQVVYYISAYCDLVTEGAVRAGEEIDVCVPTGNFGNILACYLAKRMGLPVRKLLCASNSNHVLTDFFESGTYDRNRPFHETMSPSMDILISSNLERLLYLLLGPDDCARMMALLSETGTYSIPEEALRTLREDFVSAWASEEETAAALSLSFREHGYLMDPHTAVAYHAASKYGKTSGSVPLLLVSTASAFKFPADVLRSLGEPVPSGDPADLIARLEKVSGREAPSPLKRTLSLPVRFTESVSPEEMPKTVLG